MCGIAGIVDVRLTGRTPEREALVRMVGALHHRGPDERGLYRDQTAGLAHTRLSIVDLSGGHQPLANAAGTLWIVFNGEIFNHVELRAELEALGRRFRTRSDTEVIVQAYEAWGVAAFSRMNGQWALALWDAQRKRLVLARDRLGVRPLHICEHRGRVYFASEVKAIFAADPSVPRALDAAGIDQTFTFWCTVAPRHVFAGIEELEPAHVRIYEHGSMREHVYWRPDYPEEPHREREFGGTAEDAAVKVRAALEQATALRTLRADVPVGAYVSGGLDSALIAALGRRVTSGRFQTFSLRFADAEYDEGEFQREVVRTLGSEHHELQVSRGDIAEALPDVVFHTERPILRSAPVPLFLLSRLTRAHGIKVVLTGEGADEVFAGYDIFREGKVRRFWARAPDSTTRPRALERLYPYLARSPVAQQAIARQFFGRDLQRCHEPGFAHYTRWQSTAALKRLFSPVLRAAIGERSAADELVATLPATFGRWSALAQDQFIEQRTLLAGYILSSQGDRMSMSHSVEGRFPFLDKDVVALAESLPPRYKLRGLDEKHVLKRAARGIVPQAVLDRPKQPYRAPDALAFVSAPAPGYLEALMSETSITDAGVFDARAVRQLWEKCKARANAGQFSNSDNMALLGVLSTQLLHQRFVQSCPSAPAPAAFTVDVDRAQPVYT